MMFSGVVSSLCFVAALGHRRFESDEELALTTGQSDVTDVIRDYDALRMGRCCCDMSSRSWFPGSTPADCEVFFGHAGQCGELTAAQRSNWGGRRMSHYPRNGQCQVSRVHRDEVNNRVRESMSAVTDMTLFASTLAPQGRCCCDIAERSERSLLASTRSHRCSIFFLNGGHCKDVTPLELSSHYLHSGGRELNSHGSTEAGKCFFDTMSLDSVAKLALETAATNSVGPGGYCSASEQEDGSFTRTARMGEEVAVTCPLGSRSAHTVLCGYATPTSGSPSPTPRCESVPDFCAALPEVEGGPAPFAQERDIVCSPGTFPEVSKTTCGADGSFSPAPRCLPECISQPTFLAGNCAGPSVNIGACFTTVGQMKRWRCWDRMTDPRSQTRDECRLSGYEGACVFGDHSDDPAHRVDYPQCQTLDIYHAQCGQDPHGTYEGACYIEGVQSAEDARWGCIERRFGFDLSDCRAMPLPLELVLETQQMTYSGACRFS